MHVSISTAVAALLMPSLSLAATGFVVKQGDEPLVDPNLVACYPDPVPGVSEKTHTSQEACSQAINAACDPLNQPEGQHNTTVAALIDDCVAIVYHPPNITIIPDDEYVCRNALMSINRQCISVGPINSENPNDLGSINSKGYANGSTLATSDWLVQPFLPAYGLGNAQLIKNWMYKCTDETQRSAENCTAPFAVV
ncbi:MAG: hypothetical protein M1825_004977 [Sarcosagium campestre]|nr:MAG: hypothetical protein M1825_004977 [Sarcosagium campestre]